MVRERFQCCDRRQAEQSENQSVLDQILSIDVTVKFLEDANHGIIPFSAHSSERGLTAPVG